MSFCTVGSSKRLPISLLLANIVFSGLVTAYRFAGTPIRRWPSSVKATIEGVVLMPSEFSMTRGKLPSITATHELVVPRSIPITFEIPTVCRLAELPVFITCEKYLFII
jgi:hypothetical protein